MRLYWIFVATLFCTLPLSLILQIVAHSLGCVNYFELGCEPGLGNTFGMLGAFLSFLTFITYPAGVLFFIIGIVITEVRKRKAGR